MKVAIIGAGNVAWHIAQALATVGHQIVAVYSRTQQPREELVSFLPGATAISSLNLENTAVDIILIAIKDAALESVAQQLQVKAGTIVVHTAGSVPMSVLGGVEGAHIGVLYPLQTFSKSKPVDFAQIPILVEAQDDKALQKLSTLARAISREVHHVSSPARKQLHLAAVFACNFTNHLLGISQQLLQEADLPPQLLQPLIQETIAKAMAHHPFKVQTGPAVRNDQNVINEHLSMLKQHSSYQALYEKLTQSIQEEAQTQLQKDAKNV